MESQHQKRPPLIATIATVVFSLAMSGSALLFLSGSPKVGESLGALGYPAYLARLLGVAKLLGVAALWVPVPRTLREWAFAGFVFNLVGAVVSHLASAGQAAHALQPAILLVPLLISYTFSHRRKLGQTPAGLARGRIEAWR
jgi:hypothetical protein